MLYLPTNFLFFRRLQLSSYSYCFCENCCQLVFYLLSNDAFWCISLGLNFFFKFFYDRFSIDFIIQRSQDNNEIYTFNLVLLKFFFQTNFGISSRFLQFEFYAPTDVWNCRKENKCTFVATYKFFGHQGSIKIKNGKEHHPQENLCVKSTGWLGISSRV